jgi:hypothetical protein
MSNGSMIVNFAGNAMAETVEMRLVQRSDRPSRVVDQLSGLEFFLTVRDVQPGFATHYCEWKERVVCACRIKSLGLIETELGGILKFVGSLGETRKNFSASGKHFRPEELKIIGPFERLLPRLIIGWQALHDHPRYEKENIKVVVELTDESNTQHQSAGGAE